MAISSNVSFPSHRLYLNKTNLHPLFLLFYGLLAFWFIYLEYCCMSIHRRWSYSSYILCEIVLHYVCNVLIGVPSWHAPKISLDTEVHA